MIRFLSARDEGRICLVGAPFDSTVSYRPGARFGPEEIRKSSQGLETFSTDQEYDLDDCPFMDMGDLELPFGDPSPVLDMIEGAINKILSQGRIPFLLGGEHLVTLGALKAVTGKFQDLKLVHLDAHADLRDDYLGQRLSHASVIRRALDILGTDRIRQFGVRSCTRVEYPLMRKLAADIPEIIAWAGRSPCYITCDLDILDTSAFPGTGTPEPGGVSFQDLSRALVSLIKSVKAVGVDAVELAPNMDPTGISSITAAKIVRECIIALCRADS
jgi:agmatinase